MSRQRKWQLAHQEADLCVLCNEKAHKWHLCLRHFMKSNPRRPYKRTIQGALFGTPEYTQRRNEIALAYQSGDTTQEVADRFKICRGTVINISRELGVQIRHKGPVKFNGDHGNRNTRQ